MLFSHYEKEIKCGFQISGVQMVINFHLTLGVEGILNLCTGYTHYTHLVSSKKTHSQELWCWQPVFHAQTENCGVSASCLCPTFPPTLLQTSENFPKVWPRL